MVVEWRDQFRLARTDDRYLDPSAPAEDREAHCGGRDWPGRRWRRRGSPPALRAPWRRGRSSPALHWRARTGRAGFRHRRARTRRGSGRARRFRCARTPARADISSSIGSRAASPSRRVELSSAVERTRKDGLEEARRSRIVGHREQIAEHASAHRRNPHFRPIAGEAPPQACRSGRRRDRTTAPGPSRSAARPAGWRG